MKTSPAGLALIARFEGFSPVPYLCPAGWWTIGYGHVIRECEGVWDNGAPAMSHKMDQAAAQELLKMDVCIAACAVAKFIRVPLTQNQFDALVSFTFNLGAGVLQRSTLRRIINRGEHASVPHQLLRFVWGGGRKLPGLVKRRAAEAGLYSGF